MGEAITTDEAEDELYGEARGDELHEELRTAEGRREFLRKAREELEREQQAEDSERIDEPAAKAAREPEFCFDSRRIIDAGGGRRRWLSEGGRQLEQHRWDNPDPIPRSRRERMLLAAERLEAPSGGANRQRCL